MPPQRQEQKLLAGHKVALQLRKRRDYLRVQGSRQALRGRFLLLVHAAQPALWPRCTSGQPRVPPASGHNHATPQAAAGTSVLLQPTAGCQGPAAKRAETMPEAATSAHAASRGPTGARAGFTVSRKVGNAVTRNRVKRRLRALWAAQGASMAIRDLVFVAFASAATASFSDLAKEFSWLCRQMQARLDGSTRSPGCS